MKICKICQVKIGDDVKLQLPEIDPIPIICDQCKTESSIKELFYDLNHIEDEPSVNVVEQALFSENIKEEFDVGAIKEEVCEDDASMPVCIDMSTNTSYYCHDCGFCIDSKKSLTQHIYTNHKKKEYQCKQCDYSSYAKRCLTQHKHYKHSRRKHYTCNECDFRTPHFVSMQYHKMTHLGEKTYKCQDCSFSTMIKRGLKVHVMLIHSKGNNKLPKKSEKKLKCTECNYTSDRKSSLRAHMCKHLGEKPFKCDKCDFACAHKSYLKQHVNLVHNKGENKTRREIELKFECTECNCRFDRKSSLKEHMCEHFGEKPLKCDKCDYTCANFKYLGRHVNRMHSNEDLIKNYKCDKCEYVTTYKPLLHTHMWSHAEEKPYRCTECNYGCSHLSNFQIHMRKHTGERPFRCDKCNETFGYKKSLKAHYTRKHSKEEFVEYHMCIKCQYVTTSKSLLVAHKLSHEKQKRRKHTG